MPGDSIPDVAGRFFLAFRWQLVDLLWGLAALGALLLLARCVPRRWAGVVTRPGQRLWRRWAFGLTRPPLPWLVPLVGAVAIVSFLLAGLIAGTPIARVHDEFSYLLAADTFARGRLSNPPHPMWRHFETIHEIFQPTYASKFQPGQGLALALGQVLFGSPWAGALISTAAAVAALAWALLGWLRPRWALLGALLACVHPQFVLWSHMYWGGGVGMLGGALIAGAIPRILRQEHPGRNAGILALGGAIVAGTRPYEAIVWAILSAATLLGWIVVTMLRASLATARQLAGRVVLSALPVLLGFVGFQAYYNWRVTGDATLAPYLLHTRAYMAVPLMFWQPMPPPRQYGNEQLRQQHEVMEKRYYLHQKTLRGWAAESLVKAFDFARQQVLCDLPILAGVLALPLALGGRADWRLWLAIVYAVGFVAAYAAIPWFVHHYTAPAMPVLFVLAMRGLRRLRAGAGALLPRRNAALLLWLAVASCIPMLIATCISRRRTNHSGWWYQRHLIQQQLLNEPGQHLVLVCYDAQHDARQEWVYNGAEIDRQKLIWARSLGVEQDQRLLEYYPERQVWRISPDEKDSRPLKIRGRESFSASNATTAAIDRPAAAPPGRPEESESTATSPSTRSRTAQNRSAR
ncbi:hypothetical protein [Fontivita pretiosa]|uniref:hypothetical protein n=1 Tax=Fontivita pretiosa TaxID=2989684 RepID=UPI003D176FA4